MAQLSTFHHDFSSDPTFLGFRGGTGSVDLSTGRLVLTASANNTSYWSFTEANRVHSLTSDAIYIKVAGAPATPAEWGFGVLSGAGVGNLVQIWRKSDGNLALRRRIADVDTTVTLSAYVPANHTWVRLRESGGTIFADASSALDDATVWTTLGSIAKSTLNLNTVGIDIWCYGNNNGQYIVDNLNITGRQLGAASAIFY